MLFLRLFFYLKMYLLPYCDLIQSIYYIYHDKRLGYRPSKMATTVYEREIGVDVVRGTDISRVMFKKAKTFPSFGKHRHTMRAEPMTFCSAIW